MVDVALFELENVLFDTRELRRSAVTEACAAHGIVAAAEPDQLERASAHAAIQAILTANGIGHDDVLIDLIARRAERAFSARLAQRGAVLAPGAAPFVADAASAARLAVVTRASRGDAELLLRLSGLDGAFSVVITSSEVLDAKPSPEGHRAALERMARQRPVRHGAAIALEDGSAGIRAARAAGARCVAAGDVPAHVAMEADAYLASLAETSLGALDKLSTPGPEHVR
ncbi:MAG TPA: HAD hydrolase-like protein [Gemmatimonadaceae bacterium]|nr:HAD hydrolase-like protein [Gemmatimonadaceae bacterium]